VLNSIIPLYYLSRIAVGLLLIRYARLRRNMFVIHYYIYLRKQALHASGLNISSDNGSNFSVNRTAELMKRMSCNPRFSTSVQPHACGLVEPYV